MTLLDPSSSLANLTYIGYNGDTSSAFQITRRRRLDRKRQQSQRNVFQCFVFGPRNAGKSALLNSLIGRLISPLTYNLLLQYILVKLKLYYCSASTCSIILYDILRCILRYLYRAFSEKYTPTASERFAANIVELPGVSSPPAAFKQSAHHSSNK